MYLLFILIYYLVGFTYLYLPIILISFKSETVLANTPLFSTGLTRQLLFTSNLINSPLSFFGIYEYVWLNFFKMLSVAGIKTKLCFWDMKTKYHLTLCITVTWGKNKKRPVDQEFVSSSRVLEHFIPTSSNSFPKWKTKNHNFKHHLNSIVLWNLLDEENFKTYPVYSIHLKFVVNMYVFKTVHLAVPIDVPWT